MGFISKGLKLGSVAAGVAAVLVSIVFFSSVPTKLGFYRWLAGMHPALVGMTPANSYGVPWKFTFDELYALDLLGQTAVITGANSGVGYALAGALSRLGADVTIACRDDVKCQTAAATIRANPQTRGTVRSMTIDTGSLASVQSFAKAYLSGNEGRPLDMLFLNAGSVYASRDDKNCVPVNADGIEQIFAENYLGHHLLYRWLEPALLKSEVARVVSTSSASSFDTYTYHVATDLQTLNGCSEPYLRGMGNLSYGQSKLAQIVWTKFVSRRLGGDDDSSKHYVNVFHPGLVGTKICDKFYALAPAFAKRLLHWMKNEVMWTPAEGALTGLYLGAAVARLQHENVRGKYFHPQSQEVVNEPANNERLQIKLWEFSEELVKDYLPPVVVVEELPTEIAEGLLAQDFEDEVLPQEMTANQ